MMLSAAAGPSTTDPVCIGRHQLRAYRAEAQTRLWRIRGVTDVVVFAHISSIYPYIRTVVMNNLAVANRMYVSNLAVLNAFLVPIRMPPLLLRASFGLL
jgi:uncharacterized membrane protein YobD (UPF0266 family)